MINPILRDYQKTMVEFSLENPKSIWYGAMSIGKTLAGLELFTNYPKLKLVLAPKAALSVWLEDYEKFNYDKQYNLVVLDTGTSKDKKKILDKYKNTNTVIVVNYATAWRIDLTKYKFDIVIADEGHKFGNPTSRQTKLLSKQLAATPVKVIATGTLYHDGLERLWSISRFLDLDVYPSSYNAFLHEYFNVYTHNYITIPSSVKNTDKLVYKIAPYVVKVDNTNITLPQVIEREYTYDLPPKLRSEYTSLVDNGIIQLEDDLVFSPHVLSRLIRGQKLLSTGELETLDNSVAKFDIKERVRLLETILDSIGTSAPIVIFTRFKRDIDIIKDLFKEDVSLLTGDTDNHVYFKEGKTRILLVNIAAGNAGIRLERADYVIFWNYTYSLVEYEQALSRVIRSNNTSKSVGVFYITANDTIDREILNVLRTKKKITNYADKVIS